MTQHTRFRSLSRDDEPFLWEMLYHAIFVPPGAPPLPREIVNEPAIARYVAGWGRDGDHGVLALDPETGAPVGAAWNRRFPSSDPGYGFVRDDVPELSIALLPERRGRGIGTALMQRLIEDTEHRAPAVSLSVSPDNPAARLYARLGFESMGAVGGSIVMKKDLGAKTVRGLEERLLLPSIRKSAAEVDAMLADDFVEIGASGRRYAKADVLASLQAEPPAVSISIEEFQTTRLAIDVLLATYRAVKLDPTNSQRIASRRSSLWTWRDGRWRQVFHQGTLESASA